MNLNLTLLTSLREGTLPGLQLPFMLYDFYLKFQTALTASDLASWSLVILVHMLVLSTSDGVHLLILHFNNMTGFPQRDDLQLDRLIETLIAEAHIVSRPSSPQAGRCLAYSAGAYSSVCTTGTSTGRSITTGCSSS